MWAGSLCVPPCEGRSLVGGSLVGPSSLVSSLFTVASTRVISLARALAPAVEWLVKARVEVGAKMGAPEPFETRVKGALQLLSKRHR